MSATLELIEKAQTLAAIKPVDGDAQNITLNSLIVRFGGAVHVIDPNRTWSSQRKQWVHDLQVLLKFEEPDCDGRDGKMTWTAVVNQLGGNLPVVLPTKPPASTISPLTAADLATLDPHTAKWLITLHPVVQPLAFAH